MSFYKHNKTGGTYTIICEALRESDKEPMVVYRQLGTDNKWVRPATEFHDGRFSEVNTWTT